MKKIYKCEKCGKDFDDSVECLKHEKKCDENMLERRIDELERRLKILEDYIAVTKSMPFPITVPPGPYTPSYPVNPSEPAAPSKTPWPHTYPPIWCDASKDSVINMNVTTGGSSVQEMK